MAFYGSLGFLYPVSVRNTLAEKDVSDPVAISETAAIGAYFPHTTPRIFPETLKGCP